MTADRDQEFSRYVTERSGALLRVAYLLTGNRADLKEGVSITDGCIGWEETESLILSAHRRLADATT